MKTSVRSLAALLVLGSGLALYSGCAGSPTRKSTGEMLDDATITTRVKTALLNDPDVGGMRIDVDTFKGVVTLSGRVKTKEEEAKALSLARKIGGVTDVKSTLLVQP